MNGQICYERFCDVESLPLLLYKPRDLREAICPDGFVIECAATRHLTWFRFFQMLVVEGRLPNRRTTAKADYLFRHQKGLATVS